MSTAKIQAALESALNNMEGLVPAVGVVSSTSDDPTVFVASQPHRLKSNVSVTLSGHSTVNGSYSIEVMDGTKFRLRSLADGSYVSTKTTGEGGQIKADLTEWENTSLSPIVGIPYQRVHMLFAEPETIGMGVEPVLTRESGFMQITLHYPKQVGTGDVNARIDLIKRTFKKNTTLTYDGVNVIVTNTPEKVGGAPLEQSYAVAVRVPFRCDIYS